MWYTNERMFSFLFFFFFQTLTLRIMHIYQLFVLRLVAMWLAKSKSCDYREAMLGHVKKKKKAYDSHAPSVPKTDES